MHTWPPLDLLIEPALILWPVLIAQWAAVKIVQLSIMVPPQNWNEPDSIATCQGIMVDASCPPTIFPCAIKSGMLAS